MIDVFEIIINILVYINLYWYVFPVIFIPGVYYIFLKIFAFPLSSNKSHDFIIITRPEKAIIKKVLTRSHPFFTLKKGLYWFSTPCSDINTNNKYHIYIEGINQDVTQMERRDNKLDDMLQTRISVKQIGNHQIRIPLKIKDHLHRHWTITLEPTKKLAVLTPVDKPQPFKLSLYHSLGIYIQEDVEVEKEQEVESGNAGQVLIALTTETLVQQINYVQSYAYFSSSSAFNLWKRRLRIDQMFVTWLKGSMDPRIMAAFVLLIAGISAVVVMSIFMKPELPPMPTG